MKKGVLVVFALFAISLNGRAQEEELTTRDVATPEAENLTRTETSSPSAWTLQYLGETAFESFDKDNRTVRQDNYFYFIYNHTTNFTSTARLVFSNDIYKVKDGQDADTDPFYFGQHVYQAAHASLFKLPGDIEGSGYLRLYFPTSRASLDDKQVLRVRPRLDLTRRFGDAFSVGVSDFVDTYFRRTFISGAGKYHLKNYLLFDATVTLFDSWSTYVEPYNVTKVTTEGDAANYFILEYGTKYVYDRFTVAAWVYNETRHDDMASLFDAEKFNLYFNLKAVF